MARMVDMACPHCGTVVSDHLLSMADNLALLFCKGCKARRTHYVVCNGGVRGPRVRVNDFPPPWSRYWEGHAKLLDVDAVHDDGQATERPVTRPDGSAIRLDRDKSAERRDRLHHKRRQERGQNPIYLDRRRQ